MRIVCKGSSGRWIRSAGAGFLLVAAGLLGWAEWAQSSTNPVLKVTWFTNDSISLWITNGVSTNFYEIFRQDNLNTPAQSSIAATGALGQTNFTIPRANETRRFFKAAVNNDWDGDGVPNIRDADPRNTNVGLLTITIRTPTNGANIQ